MKNNNIWNKNELKEINKIIYSKNVNIVCTDDEVTFCRRTKNSYVNFTHSGLTNDLLDTFEFLLTNTNKDEIDRILTKYSKVNFDINNKLHFGLISSLSRLDLNKSDKYYPQIFTIAKELVGQYERVISSVINNSFANITDTNIIKDKIENIKQNVSNEEKQVNFLMQKIFNESNGLNNEALFKDVINKCNSKIRMCLLSRANYYLAMLNEKKAHDKLVDVNNHKNEFREKYCKKSLNTRKKYYGGYI